MINHMRTLLLNRSRDQLACEWDEYVHARFTPQQLPAVLQTIWEILFGSDPDRYMLNWRGQQYTQILHSTEYRVRLAVFDVRFTYDLSRVLDNATLPWAAVQPQTGLSVLGKPLDDAQRGRLTRLYQVSQLDATNFELTDVAYGRTQNAVFTGTAIPLGDSGLSIMPADTAAAQWHIHTLAAPSVSLAQVLGKLEQLPPASLTWLFNGGQSEPYRSYQLLWTDSRGVALQLSGLLLAWLLRAEEARHGHQVLSQ